MRRVETLCQIHKKLAAMLGTSISRIEDLTDKFEEAIPLHEALKEIYESLTKALENDPPPKIRTILWH